MKQVRCEFNSVGASEFFLGFICNCLSYFTTAKISFTSILYLQFTHMIFIIYTSCHSVLNKILQYLQYNCNICINKHGKSPSTELILFLLLSPYAQRFSEQTTNKSHAKQCLALHSRWWTQQTQTFFQLGLSAVQTSEPMSKTQGDRHVLLKINHSIAIPFLFGGCYVTYCIGIISCKRCIIADLEKWCL